MKRWPRLEALNLVDVLRIWVRSGANFPGKPFPDFQGPRERCGHHLNCGAIWVSTQFFLKYCLDFNGIPPAKNLKTFLRMHFVLLFLKYKFLLPVQRNTTNRTDGIRSSQVVIPKIFSPPHKNTWQPRKLKNVFHDHSCVFVEQLCKFIAILEYSSLNSYLISGLVIIQQIILSVEHKSLV